MAKTMLYGILIGSLLGAGFLYFAAQEEAKRTPPDNGASTSDS